MPQQFPRRASLRARRARRTPAARAVTTSLAAVTAAALAATTAVPAVLTATPHAARTTATFEARAVDVAGSSVATAEVAPVHADPVSVDPVAADPAAGQTDPRQTDPRQAGSAQADPAVVAAVAQASGTLAGAEHVTTEGNGAPPEQIAQIQQATSVVRELVRRATAAATPAAVPTTTLPEVGAAADAAVTAAIGTATTGDVDAQAVTAALAQQTAALAELVEATPAAAIAVAPAPPTPEEIAAQRAAEEAAARAAAAQAAAQRAAEEAAARAAEQSRLASVVAEAKKHGNGRIPARLLASLPWSPGNTLRADAAAALTRLNDAFRAAFGTDLGVTDSYRSYASQVAVKRSRGFWAARPGHSNHGLGLAVDLGTGVSSFGTPQYRWMKANAPKFGWTHPDWAEPGGRKPEPWHWEFTG
ncbi:M15 family metallopeptidase [Xylanimonas protaetiae]|uniref:D-alanyl-D-alanine carboxypeptidase-like core domain-containing protein n=1 Tax=Xylanimonas protaetiae TaxID=2509457 RepID=A0A4P6FF73_9MICO|nr:M15 family metallopeptidase [Xylanimonas protaetiae]QAY69258.1 hypothetical protein ET471_03735 [Xylanimonas protaetiae]